MPERPARALPVRSQPRATDARWPRADADHPISLTLRIRNPDGAQARTCLDHLLRDIPGLRIMTVSRYRGIATLALLAPRDTLDAMLHRIMVDVPGAEFGPIQPATLAAVH